MAAYNKRAKELGRPLTVLDNKITAALLKESAIIAGSTTSGASTSSTTPASRAPGVAPSSGYKGISLVASGKFAARIRVDGTTEVLGSE